MRGDAVDLPFRDSTFDAVSCYGALYLMDDPMGALGEMIRVLRPGRPDRACSRRARADPRRRGRSSVAASRLAPLRLFDSDEITGAMRAAGLVDVSRTVTAASQTVSAT